MFKKILYFFILLGAIIGAGFWTVKGNLFSKEILHMELEGPKTAVVGEEIAYTVKYKNNGNFSLHDLKLSFRMPSYSLTEDGKTLISQELEDLESGESGVVTIKTRLLGKEGDIKKASAMLTYTPENLTARYELDDTFETTLDVVPMAFEFKTPPSTDKGGVLSYTLAYNSQVNYPLENITIKIHPVDGFTIKESTPRSLNNEEWRIASLQSGQGGSISVTGDVSRDFPDRMTLTASMGIWQNGTFVVIKNIKRIIVITEPAPPGNSIEIELP